MIIKCSVEEEKLGELMKGEALVGGRSDGESYGELLKKWVAETVYQW